MGQHWFLLEISLLFGKFELKLQSFGNTQFEQYGLFWMANHQKGCFTQLSHSLIFQTKESDFIICCF
jgi:succinate-acetate transporter protein